MQRRGKQTITIDIPFFKESNARSAFSLSFFYFCVSLLIRRETAEDVQLAHARSSLNSRATRSKRATERKQPASEREHQFATAAALPPPFLLHL